MTCYTINVKPKIFLQSTKDKMVLPDDDAMLLALAVDNVFVKYSLLANWVDKEGHVLLLFSSFFVRVLFWFMRGTS